MVEQAQSQDGAYLWSSAHSTAQSSNLYERVKRVFDLAISTACLVPAIAVGLLIAVALKLDSPGPVFFKQVRIGRWGEPFEIVKFRTMYWPPEPDLHREHVIERANGSEAGQGQLRIPSDPRITRVGRFLRKWSLDEMPNLWNVLRGEMSIVGPRPLVPYEVGALDEHALRRLEAQPGITGLAQVNGRLDVSIHERADYDVRYASQRSIAVDLLVLLRTPFALLRRRGI